VEEEDTIIFSESVTTSDREVQEKDTSRDFFEAGASTQFEFDKQSNYRVQPNKEFIIHNRSRTITIDIYNDDDSSILDEINYISQHPYDYFLLLKYTELEVIDEEIADG
jgi:hypothetical protein